MSSSSQQNFGILLHIKDLPLMRGCGFPTYRKIKLNLKSCLRGIK